MYVGQTCNLSERWRNNAIKKYGWDNFTHEVVYSNLNKQAADKLEKELIHKYNSIEEGYNLKEGGSRGELSTKSLAKMSESLKRGYSEFPERREKIRNKALGRKMPKDTRCKISLNHSKSNLLKINDEVGSIRYWALKIGKAHSVLSYRLKVHGIDNLRKSIVHEAEHIKNHIWQYIGYTPQRDNDEVDAYLLTYIYDKITQVFYKHKDNKE